MLPPSVAVLSALLRPALADAPLHHDLSVRLDPEGHAIQAVDTLSLDGAVQPDADGAYRFVLHAGLAPRVLTRGWKLEPVAGPVAADFFGINATSETLPEDVPLEAFRLVPKKRAKYPVAIELAGVIDHPPEQVQTEYQRSFAVTPGVVGPEGVFLAGTSFWVPTFGDQMLTFQLSVTDLVEPWDVVSQGQRMDDGAAANADDGAHTTVWHNASPTDEIYLVAGPWHEYSVLAERDQGEPVQVLAFLREDDPGLAHRYLQATRRYLALYEDMLPAYPYGSFALVENFWETGYGMPGFTLLGPQVIRFPWVLTSSYPHELLHNWWGNSAYVDRQGGNWCEGLTAYMADHLFAEQKGEGATYRRDTLKRFTDFVSAEEDFPLVQFGSRSSASTEAVGYGKSAMLWHMARMELGDEAFLAGISHFYETWQWQHAGFMDVAKALSESSGKDLVPFFEAWTTRTGAPDLKLAEVKVTQDKDKWTLDVVVEQVQDGEPFPLRVPVAVTAEGSPQAEIHRVSFDGNQAHLVLELSSRPLRVDVDPEFDVMRRLDPTEVPPMVSTLMGADSKLFVLPAKASPEEIEAWKALAEHWAKPAAPVIKTDAELGELPGGNVWVLGWSNAFAPKVAAGLQGEGVSWGKDALTVAGEQLSHADHSAVILARAADDPDAAVGFVGSGPVEAIAGLARKLPHYTRYSYLGFKGSEPGNMLKGTWSQGSSPLSRVLVQDASPATKLIQRPPLAELPPVFSASELSERVAWLADAERKGRGLGTPELEASMAWVEKSLSDVGMQPLGESYRQTWTWTGGEPEQEMTLSQVVAMIPGTDPKLADQPVVVMAHVDHLGTGWPDVRAGNEGKVHPGADDNASGVAVVLEVARAMVAEPARPRPVVFAFTTGEEAGLLGSRHLVEQLGGKAMACVNVDTVGNLGGGKLNAVGASSAKEWRYLLMGVGYTTGLDIGVVSEPLGTSDQVACGEAGVPAIHLFTTPTPRYHSPEDTIDTVDVKGLVTIAESLQVSVAYLAERTEPLTAQEGGGAPAPAQGGERKASLGTMPDFTFAGPGVLVQEVTKGSAAEAAGIKNGDILLELDGKAIEGLRAYSGLLKAHQPGDVVKVKLKRGDQELTVQAKLTER